MNFRNIHHYFSEALENLGKNILVSVAAILTVAISLTILGGFLLVLINIRTLADSVANNFEVVVFLKEDVTSSQVAILKSKFLYIEGVEKVNFISREEALDKMKEDLKEKVNIEDILPYNPLPHSLVIKVDRAENIEKIIPQIKKEPAVEKIKFGRELLTKLLSLIQIIKLAGVAVGIFLAVGTMLLITNTIKLAVFARRREIKIMQLVGATDWFMRWPFLLEGMFQGIIGAAVACGILISSYLYLADYLQKVLPFIPIISDISVLINLTLIIFSSGTLLGILGSMMAVGKFSVE